MWQAETAAEVRRFAGHTNWVNSAVFSPDGQYVLTASDDRTARLWETAMQGLINRACARLFRDLTTNERRQYGLTDTAPTCPHLANGDAAPPLPTAALAWTPYPISTIPVWTPLAITPTIDLTQVTATLIPTPLPVPTRTPTLTPTATPTLVPVTLAITPFPTPTIPVWTPIASPTASDTPTTTPTP